MAIKGVLSRGKPSLALSAQVLTGIAKTLEGTDKEGRIDGTWQVIEIPLLEGFQ